MLEVPLPAWSPRVRVVWVSGALDCIFWVKVKVTLMTRTSGLKKDSEIGNKD